MNILNEKENNLPINKRKKILKKKINENYSWLNKSKYQIDDKFDTAVFNRLRGED